jgi:hypothetical protein
MIYRTTSHQAFKVAKLGKNQGRVLEFIRTNGTAICDEVIRHVGMPHQCASPAFTALERKGLIRRTGATRLTRTGCQASVFTLGDPEASLFHTPTASNTQLRQAVIKAALVARATGDWSAFNSAYEALPISERKSHA